MLSFPMQLCALIVSTGPWRQHIAMTWKPTMDNSLPLAQHQWTTVARDANGSGPQGKLGQNRTELCGTQEGKGLNREVKIPCPRWQSEPSFFHIARLPIELFPIPFYLEFFFQ